MRFTCRSEKDPTVGGKGGGPFSVSAPHFLKSGDISILYEPGDYLLDGCVNPGKAVNIVCDESEVHYLLLRIMKVVLVRDFWFVRWAATLV